MHAGKAGVELGDEAGYMYVNDLGFRVMVRFSSLFIDTLKKEWLYKEAVISEHYFINALCGPHLNNNTRSVYNYEFVTPQLMY